LETLIKKLCTFKKCVRQWGRGREGGVEARERERQRQRERPNEMTKGREAPSIGTRRQIIL
jgi:hypothetical protein